MNRLMAIGNKLFYCNIIHTVFDNVFVIMFLDCYHK